MLRCLPPTLVNPAVMVGLESPDDAGVYRISDDIAIVQTVDFFTPVVDDPYWFGAIAAANALSDIYAMGAKPVTALNLVGFPVAKLEKRILAEILRGGAEKLQEAEVALLGGHSVDDPEPKYGLAVTGTVHPDHVLTKAGARPGDRLVLTKPIGVGVVTTAIKRGVCAPAHQDEAIRVMATLNNLVDVLEPFAVHGLTDVTGFGLLGHASEMARESRAGLRLWSHTLPLLPGTEEYAEQNIFPGGSNKNYDFLTGRGHVSFDPSVAFMLQRVLCDAVTSGGLLIAVAGEQADALARALQARGTPAAAIIGEVVSDHPGRIMVMP